MSSISVRFNSFLFLYSIFNEHIVNPSVNWSVWMDSNHRPHAYQACALTTWATDRSHLVYPVRPSLRSMLSFENEGISLSEDWWRWWGSNPWPPACRAGALPAELHPLVTWAHFFKDQFPDLRKLNNKSFHTVLPISSFRLRHIRENTSWSP